jgi:hypothetical protein
VIIVAGIDPPWRCLIAADLPEVGPASINQLKLFEPEGLRHPSPVRRVSARAIVDVPLLDVQLGVTHGPRRVLEQHLPLSRRHLSKQVSGLFPMVVVNAVIPMPRRPLYRQHRLNELRLVCPQTLAVGMIGERASEITIDPHLAVTMITLKGTFRRVHRDQIEIDSKSIPLRADS